MMEWVSVKERLPDNETPVLAVYRGNIRILEIRTEHPTFEETYRDFDYWDDPENDGQDIEWRNVTHWMPLPQPPKDTE